MDSTTPTQSTMISPEKAELVEYLKNQIIENNKAYISWSNALLTNGNVSQAVQRKNFFHGMVQANRNALAVVLEKIV